MTQDNSIPLTATAVSPTFKVTAEEYLLHYFQTLSKIDIDIVYPPSFGWQGGYSRAMEMVNQWSPWVDEKLVEPKYDGICQYLGVCSNRPSYVKDYYLIGLLRAVDYILAPTYVAMIQAEANGPVPNPPPTS
jgi:hypothetical protein